jgi:ferredoxin/bacterioferritin-associated ferredoxin
VKLVKHAIDVIEANCTGCYRCERACPTNAITMVGPRRQALAVVDNDACISCFRCIDVCPDDAMLPVERAEPRRVGTRAKSADPAALARICDDAGVDPEQIACLCSSTKNKELAAAALNGATTFESLAGATGASSGCLIYCGVPMRLILEAATHAEVDESGAKVRRYDSAQSLLSVDESAADRYPLFALRAEQARARQQRSEQPS